MRIFIDIIHSVRMPRMHGIIIYTVERYMSGPGLQLLVIVWLELYTSVYSVCCKECRSNRQVRGKKHVSLDWLPQPRLLLWRVV